MNLDHQLALRAIRNGKAPLSLRDELFVGRGTELALFEHDLELVEAGGASLRIVVGDPGAGKTMLLQEMGRRARARGFVTAEADLSPDRLLHGRGGEGRRLLGQTMLQARTASTSEDEGGAGIDAIIGRFGNDCRGEADAAGELPRDLLRAKLDQLHGQPKGADFAKVIQTFALARESSGIMANARRWLCGEYAAIADAREDLGLGSIVEDHDFWAMQRLWGSFAKITGRPGFVLLLDEARVLCDLHNPNARALNLEQLLMMLNDIVQARVRGIGVVIAATPAFVTQWNGLAKHEGLNSCLEPQLLQEGLHEENGNALVNLRDLGDGELLELLRRCRQLYATCHPAARILPDEALEAFLDGCRNQIGEARWHLPRIIIQRFIALQDQLVTDPKVEWHELLSGEASRSDDSGMEFEGYASRQM